MIGNLQLAKKQNKKEKLEKEIYETLLEHSFRSYYASHYYFEKIIDNEYLELLVTKVYELNKKYFPKMFWNSRKDGTYRKKKKVGI